jgi:prolipoprotein diacylglyceryltransferase
MEFTLLWAALTAVAMTWAGLRLWPDRLPDNAFDRLLGAGVAGLVTGRLAAMATQGVNPLASPGDILIIRGGVLTGVAASTFVLVLYWSTGSRGGALDALAPAVVLGLAGWHGGCLWRGACLGAQSDLPWAWALEGSAITRHPVELYAAFGLAVAAWLVSRIRWRPWLRFGVALALVAGIRLATESLRPSITGGPVSWYAAGMLVGVLATVIGPRLASRPRADPT